MSEEDPKAEAPTETENPESSEDKNEAEKESSRPPTAKSTQDEVNYYSDSFFDRELTLVVLYSCFCFLLFVVLVVVLLLLLLLTL